MALNWAASGGQRVFSTREVVSEQEDQHRQLIVPCRRPLTFKPRLKMRCV